ncbi:polymorphic toxin type 8 domain-containing protein [Acinetobacter sp. WCHAc060033]|uniref:polymorphic toxin type 8 domain-containing protein n=1 Tax=Acinetobacter sp. WCHAc060033 TaxID=2518624 RepID=UPI001D19802E|nr:polymorphic toxin type 8 domain-containing protein [Acinetobacter sp. WCHAc060033]
MHRFSSPLKGWLSKADRGWIKQELNEISKKIKSHIRNPPVKELAHERGREAAKGYDYKHSKLQDKVLHDLQHKYDAKGTKNKERPLRPDEK